MSKFTRSQRDRRAGIHPKLLASSFEMQFKARSDNADVLYALSRDKFGQAPHESEFFKRQLREKMKK